MEEIKIMQNNKQERGITLIALVITVIILLILAAITVKISLNGGDLFAKSRDAVEKWNEAVVKEGNEVNNLLNRLNNMSLPDTTTAQWEFASGGDKNSNGEVDVGDIIKPRNANISSEEFYVINTSDSTTYTLLTKSLVKVSPGQGQYTTQIGGMSPETLVFRSNESATDANVYSASDIRTHVETYANHIASYVTLQDVEIVENGSAVSGVKGRLMWGTSSSGEAQELKNANLMDVLSGHGNYWLGSPFEGDKKCAWTFYAGNVQIPEDGYVCLGTFCRPSPSYNNFQILFLTFRRIEDAFH